MREWRNVTELSPWVDTVGRSGVPDVDDAEMYVCSIAITLGAMNSVLEVVAGLVPEVYCLHESSTIIGTLDKPQNKAYWCAMTRKEGATAFQHLAHTDARPNTSAKAQAPVALIFERERKDECKIWICVGFGIWGRNPEDW